MTIRMTSFSFGMLFRLISPDFQCELVSNCQEAFKKLETPPLPEFIFMDLNMPVMNGFDCLAYLKNHQQYKDIPWSFSLPPKNEDISRTQDLGAKWYMTKPDDFNVLCKKLIMIIQKDPMPEILYNLGGFL